MILLNNPVYTNTITDVFSWEKKLLYYSERYDYVHYLKSSDSFDDPHERYDLVVGLGCQAGYTLPQSGIHIDPFDRIKELKALYNHGWLMCHLNYDVKNCIEPLISDHDSHVGFSDVTAYIPKWVITRRGNKINIFGDESKVKHLLNDINTTTYFKDTVDVVTLNIPNKLEYLGRINKVKEYIREGRIYEMNLCQNFNTQQELLDPEGLYLRLQDYADAPFSAYYKLRDRYLICSSPERYLQSQQSKVRSQPIKGTIKISDNPIGDKKALSESIKDAAEHIMIVDLVRNDLKRNSKSGTVKVDELKGIYTFKHVHHMISTISGELMDDRDVLDAIKGSFPMGSMTGAPKIEAMKVIEELESFKRGLYSGSIGYINPDGDADFNVIIRSILYNASTRIISCPVGGAIVYDSDPEQEWQECLIKLESIHRILNAEQG